MDPLVSVGWRPYGWQAARTADVCWLVLAIINLYQACYTVLFKDAGFLEKKIRSVTVTIEKESGFYMARIQTAVTFARSWCWMMSQRRPSIYSPASSISREEVTLDGAAITSLLQSFHALCCLSFMFPFSSPIFSVIYGNR